MIPGSPEMTSGSPRSSARGREFLPTVVARKSRGESRDFTYIRGKKRHVMKTREALRYNSLSLVYMQVFTVENFDHSRLDATRFVKIPNSIDRQIFDCDGLPEKPVERYRLDPFPFTLELKDDARVTGEMFVEISVFFRRAVSVTYRMMIDGKHCTCSRPLSTDDVIALAALRLGAEHWNNDRAPGDVSGKTPSNINLEAGRLEVPAFPLDAGGNRLPAPVPLESRFEEIQRRYKRFILNSQEAPPGEETRDMNYVYVDVWEDLAHEQGIFEHASAPEIIARVERYHRRELVGLMSFYPYEWPYREEEAFREVCGEDISIDTDDLVLLNQNICVVFGTYGRRGKDSPTDWKTLLEEREHYHVSWPEYLLILEMVLAKKYTLGAVLERYLKNSLQTSSLTRARELIERNAREGLKVTGELLRLDAVKYSRFISHKIMFERTARRLELEKERRQLEEMMEKVDKSLFNISEMRKLRQSTLLNAVLGIISAASLFGILLQSVKVPFMVAIGWEEFADHVGIIIIGITALIILACIAGVITYRFHDRARAIDDRQPPRRRPPLARRWKILLVAAGLAIAGALAWPGERERNAAVDVEMVLVEGGTFTMGCTPEQGDDCYDDETPARRVTVNSFYIGKYEVTQAQWRAVTGANPSRFTGDSLPVERVSWDDVQEFLRVLNARSGQRYRLPTEAEWEHAARGGRPGRGYKYSGSDNVNDVAWHDANSGGTTRPVGKKQPNELGLHDMSGNVKEWCDDRYDTPGSPALSSPYRVNRGGSWCLEARRARVPYRAGGAPGRGNDHTGFRLARDVEK
jgi:formylglycine-generating enzyme required for sulfatase activity